MNESACGLADWQFIHFATATQKLATAKRAEEKEDGKVLEKGDGSHWRWRLSTLFLWLWATTARFKATNKKPSRSREAGTLAASHPVAPTSLLD